MNEITKLSYKKLEINKILENLVSFAILPEVKEMLGAISPSDDLFYLENELKKVNEASTIITRYERAPIMMSLDFSDILFRAFKGAKLLPFEIYEVLKLFITIKANIKFLSSLKAEKIEYSFFENCVLKLEVLPHLEKQITSSIGDDLTILDGASPTLFSIRRALRGIDAKIKARCQEILNKEIDKLSQTQIVLRNDTYCLAVKIEYKNAVKGLVQDYSSSMQTVFIEPDIVNSMKKEKIDLLHQEQEEVDRILKHLSNEILKNIESLTNSFEAIKTIDFYFAKGLLGVSYNGVCPKINEEGFLSLKNARHPLLRVKKVIPNNVEIPENFEGIIITGPNTGGKTVLLKTIGLLSLMVKYGLLIPVDDGSNVMIYDNIFCDIGDDQSIENNLSTFSSHMTNIVNIVNSVTPKSLVLFDEIGAGTDPLEGSNLAIAILNYLVRKKVCFITTTHYSELKALAFSSPKIINASMEFDQNKLTPTYHLIVGVTGSSNAFNIAKRLGLNDEIISDAKTRTITNESNAQKLITKLEGLVFEQNILNKKLHEKEAKVKDLQKKLKEDLKNLEKNQDLIIKQAKTKAEEIINKAKIEGETLINELRTKVSENLKLHEVIEYKQKLNELNVKQEKPKINEDNTPLKVGDDVYIETYEQYGSIVKILKNGTFDVAIGNITMNYMRNELKKVKKQEEKVTTSTISHSLAKSKVSLTLDLRGQRYNDALDLLDKYIDDLVCASIKQATIIHGYGTGAIREMVKSYIRKSPHILSSRYGGETEGGFGVTVITLK